ncbi:restriction endonuclease subunit S [Empedobacter falsenii]|uniref:Restriction endonuclease subunit S n=1 Tax=Empedobacter falsenii TaxID=343874 RepID=A0A427BNK7_9FLAO|nr:restriction endonuclease subunit S [Empedobacter falsenii]RRT91441.1 restriction endonuclease subunit S [Empedobacter falsenii]RRT91494.1 restriction endonuclease subunit S [Empedobacter falsenii]
MRFPEFTEEWETKKLGEIGEIVNGLTYSPNDIAENGVLVLRSSNVQNRSLAFEDNVYVRTDNYNPVQENDILICVRNGSKNLIGKNALINKENEGVAFGAFMSIYRSSFNTFLFHWFDTNEYKEIVYKNLGATINSINGSDLRKFKVPFPSIEEQKKLASFLSIVDERIQTQNKILIHLKSLIESLNDSLSEQKIRINSNFENWKKVRLGDLGYTFTGLSGKTKEDFGNGKRYIQYKQIFDSSKIVIENCGYVNVSENENQNSVKYGDIFFTISSETPDEIGMSSVLLEDVKNVYLNSFCFGFRLNSFNEMLPEFARFLFRSKVVRNEIKKLAQGSTRYNMSKTELLKLEILLPSIKEQKEISSFLCSLVQKIQTEKAILEQLEIQKKYLLQQMFV